MILSEILSMGFPGEAWIACACACYMGYMADMDLKLGPVPTSRSCSCRLVIAALAPLHFNTVEPAENFRNRAAGSARLRYCGVAMPLRPLIPRVQRW